MPQSSSRKNRRNTRKRGYKRRQSRGVSKSLSSSSSSSSSYTELGLAGSLVGASALTQGSEMEQHQTEQGHSMLIGGRGGRGSGADSAEYILRFLEMLNTIKIYHWSTLSYPTHKATDELHSKMSVLVDSFIEIYIGHLSRRGGGAGAGVPVFKRGSGASTISFCECKSLDIFCKKLDGYITFMEGLTKRLDGYTDLVNIRDEMVGALAQALYLLRLH